MSEELRFQPPTPPTNFRGPLLAESTLAEVDINYLAQAISYAFSLGTFIACGQPTRTAGSDVDDPQPQVHLAEAMLYQTRITAHLLQKRHPEDPIFATSSVDQDTPDLRTFLTREFQGMKSQLGALNNKVTALDTKVTALDTKVTALDTRVGALETKVTALDTKVGSGALATRMETLTGTVQQNRVALDGVAATVQGLANTREFKSTIQQAVTEQMAGVQGLITSNSERLAAVQATTNTLQNNVTTLQDTVRDVRTTLTNVQATSAANAEALANLQAPRRLAEPSRHLQVPVTRIDIQQGQMINSGRHTTGNWIEIPNTTGILPTQAPNGALVHVTCNTELVKLSNVQLARLLCFYNQVEADRQDNFLHAAESGAWNAVKRKGFLATLWEVLTVPGHKLAPTIELGTNWSHKICPLH
ncbi:hypothetical protein OPQ81_008110 [Rhizoctonia solani]|nr:hypothetical protein OPQ81_008110 [Rhizoctonia solani]